MENLENKRDKQLPNHPQNSNDRDAHQQNQSPSVEDEDTIEVDASEQSFSSSLKIIYQDDHYIAILKPYGLLVHRTDIAEHQTEFALQKLRNQIKRWIYPIHRLDGPTTGVLVFGLHKKAASKLSDMFRQRNIKKTYYALVRGHAPDKGRVDLPIQKHGHKYAQNAVSEYMTTAKGVLPIAQFGYQQLYYSLVRVQPQTGRMHQIRKHLKHIKCPIICDRRYGDWRHNKLFNSKFEITNLFLLAKKLEFVHPYTKEPITLEVPFSDDMLQIAKHLGWDMDALEKQEQEGYYDNMENENGNENLT